MIQTYAHQKELHEAGIDIKTLERLLANVITEGTSCSAFESDIIIEPPGKPLKECQLIRP